MHRPILRDIVTDATAWRGPELRTDSSWIHPLTEAEIAEVDRAFREVKKRGLGWGMFGKELFPLPSLARKLARVDDEVRNGRGFALLKGFPVRRYTVDELKTIYWGLGVHMGQVISHNVQGDFVAA